MKSETIVRIKSGLFRLVAGSVYVWAVTGAALSATYIQLSQRQLAVSAALFMLCFCLWFFDRRTFAAISICLALCMVVLFIYLHTKDYEVEWFRQMAGFAQRLLSHIMGNTPYREEYAVLGIGLAGIIAFFASLAMRPGAGFYFISAVGFGVFIVLEYFEYNVSEYNLIAFLCIFVLMLAYTLNSAAASRTEGRMTVSGLALIPVCVALLFAAMAIPKPAAVEGRNVIDNLRANTGLADGYLYDLFTPKYFTFSTTGFSGGGGVLGGDVTPNKRHVMTVYSGGELVYLAGAYKDTYLGDRWGSSNDSTHVAQTFGEADWPIDAKYTSKTPVNYYNTVRPVTIEAGRRTRAIFIPAGTRGLLYQGERQGDISRYLGGQPDVYDGELPQLIVDSLGGLSFGQTMGLETVYTIAYYPTDGVNTLSGLSVDNSLITSLEDYKRYMTADNFDTFMETVQPYLALPEDLPQRVRDLAEEITAGKYSMYSKIKALEEFLQKYPYSLSPGPVPEGADFVDYFLFEGKTGYCTYYATALAVMGRCIGIPTRYAEGFAVTPALDMNEDGGFDVTNLQAHAWCEVYLPSAVNWVSFEATAGYASGFYGANQAAHEAEDTSTPREVPEEVDDMLDYVEERLQNRNQQTTTPAEASEEESPRRGSAAAWVFAVAVMVAAGTIALRIWLYRRRILALEASPNRIAVIGYFGRIMGIGAVRGIPIRDGETGLAYSRRIGGTLYPGPLAAGVGAIYSKAAYSGQDISDEERAEVAVCYNVMLKRINERPYQQISGWFRQYILGRY